jgi:hypothetical protein
MALASRASGVHDRRLRRILGFLEDEMATGRSLRTAGWPAARHLIFMRNHRRARSDHRRGISRKTPVIESFAIRVSSVRLHGVLWGAYQPQAV